MIKRFPSFYKDFKCIADKCKKSCCIGWELDVDPDTYGSYMAVGGKFGERLRSTLRYASDDGYGFVLPVDGRCPFLNENNLCDIVIELGEESLCDICHTYPRYRFTYGDTVDMSLTISCEEACKMLLEQTGSVKLLTESFDEDPEDDVDSSEFLERQTALFDTLANRETSFGDRINKICPIEDPIILRSSDERLRIMSLLEPVDSDWIDVLNALEKESPTLQNTWNEGAYENLLHFFLFKYLPRSIYDGGFEAQVIFSLFCVYCIHDMESVMGSLTSAASLFSREVEHSDDNIELIMEEILFLDN